MFKAVAGLDPTTVLKNIYTVANLIYDQVRLVKANEQQCRRLADRVKIIEETVHGLDRIKDKNQYKAALSDLLGELQEALEFITKFSTTSRWQRWILKAGNYKETFEELTDKLQKSALQLNLGFAAQQIVNREVDKADQQADLHFIQDNQVLIMELNRQELSALQGMHLQQQEQQEVLALQMAAIQSQLRAIVQVKGPQVGIDEKYHIPYYNLVFERLITKGAFGKIYLGKWEGQTVAIKTLEGRLTTREEERFVREVAIMSQLKHPNVTTFYGACLEEGHACLVMEYMEQRSLSKVLQQKPLTEEQQKSVTLDIAKGLLHCHHRHPQVLHRDLRSAHVLLNAQGVAKLSDFGLSKIDEMEVQTAKARSEALPWQAPECFQYKAEYTEASDVYSFGMVLWEILTGKTPTNRLLKDYATLAEREAIPSSVPSVLAQLIRECWQGEPAKRPTLNRIIERLEAYQVKPPSPSPERYYELGQTAEGQRDFLKAFEYYQKSARKGCFKAKTNLGHLHLTVVPQDKPQALHYFLEAAREGHVRAMLNAANMLEYGDGVPENKREALYWYQEICKRESNHPDAPCKVQKLQALLDSGPQYQAKSNLK